MNDAIVRFGPEGILTGIVCTPDTDAWRARPTVVMWNVGLNHHVGPSRIWVELARKLARLGMRSLRFDVAGLGDSADRTDKLGDIERAVLDLEAALDWITAHRAASAPDPGVILVSNCSGTDNAHQVATQDERVRGAVFMDGYAYETPRYHFHKHVLRWFDPARYRRNLQRRFPRAFGLDLESRAAGGVDEIFTREYPPRAVFEADLRRMVARGTKLLFTFSSESTYEYEGQFWDWLQRKDWGGSISVEYYPSASHTYSFRAERTRVLERILDWVPTVS